MKKTFYYLLIIIVLGGALVGFWVYGKYFKKDAPSLLFFKVERRNLIESVKARGEVVSEKEFNLEFPFSGTVESIFVKEGDEVKSGAPLIKLETTDFELDLKRLDALLMQAKANLDKILTGATVEDLNISKTKIENAKISLEEAKKNLIDKLRDSYTVSDDSVRNKIDALFVDPRGLNPKVSFYIADTQLKTDLENSRLLIEDSLNKWRASLNNLNIASDFDFYTREAEVNLSRINLFTDKMAYVLNNPSASQNISQTVFDGYKTSVYLARSNLSATIGYLTAAEEKYKTGRSNLNLSEREFEYKKAAARTEDVEIAQAQVSEIESQILTTREKIKKSVMYAPTNAKVFKIPLEIQEMFKPGVYAISLSASGYKIQADISELEIDKIKIASDVLVKFDAIPAEEFHGKIARIEPQEVIKEGDKYYRVNIYLLDSDLERVRSGMTCDIKIIISKKDSTLTVPDLVIYKKTNQKFVNVIENLGGVQKEVVVETGISDGEFVEITRGLVEGQIVVAEGD